MVLTNDKFGSLFLNIPKYNYKGHIQITLDLGILQVRVLWLPNSLGTGPLLKIQPLFGPLVLVEISIFYLDKHEIKMTHFILFVLCLKLGIFYSSSILINRRGDGSCHIVLKWITCFVGIGCLVELSLL